MSEKQYFVTVSIEVRDPNGVKKIGTAEVFCSMRLNDNVSSSHVISELLIKAEDTAYNLLERRLDAARSGNTESS